MKTILICSALLIGATAFAQTTPAPAKRAPASPPATAEVEINGKKIQIKYSAPSVRGRQMLGEGGRISKDPTYPVWRVGANSATSLHTDADLNINGLNVPAGDYTLFALINTDPWMLIVNKQTGQWGLSYKAEDDLGRVKMNMSKPSAPVETMKIDLTSEGGNKGKLTIEFENTVASVPFTVK
jgi:hypothetical protein